MLMEFNPALRLVGGHPALDLVNTVAPRLPAGGDHVEFLPSPADLLAWAHEIGVVDRAEAAAVEAAWAATPGGGMPAWRAALDIREALYRALIAALDDGPDEPERAAALERLTLHWSAATSRSALLPTTAPGSAARLVVGTAPALLVPDRLAMLAVGLLQTTELGQMRVCPTAEGGCGWLFLDRSRNGSRRWCSMADCGGQAKARRLNDRRRTRKATGKSNNNGSHGD
ncbi:CGNR zinc finger domain-containing protein [Paractinoplanes rhizophilus]|jgi:predicted RNA-binding Zn ribbon-like protein|uniref:CGNR zinc finger domain-containing protein n=1 Tax=Paractinoplanes rhizophilus TaxID=1416877 RepID=A0ABW2HYQ0_9ACTN|nr:CGNR zinc finger domain-containing protein [Actinoplanes sp.]